MLLGKKETQRRFWALFEKNTCLATSIIYFNYERFMRLIYSKFTINFVLIGKAVSILLKFLIAASHSS